MVDKLKFTLIKQTILEKLGNFNPEEYFHGMRIKNMEDELIDCKLKGVFH
jgi:hypothetical protein